MNTRNYKKYYQKKKYCHLRKKKSIFTNRFFCFFILGIVIFVGLFYFFIFSPVFQIRAIDIYGAHFIEESEIREEVERITEKTILFFPTKSIFLFNKKFAKQLILEKFLPCKDVIIKKSLTNRLSVNLEEREPRAVVFEQDNYFWVDNQGLIFWQTGKGSEFFDRPFIRSEQALRIGERVISQEILDFVCLADVQLSEEAGIKISEFSASPTKIEAKASNKNWSIYFSPQKDLDLQIEDLILLLKNQISPLSGGEEILGEAGGDESKGKEPIEVLQYIDLRFDKVFYK